MYRPRRASSVDDIGVLLGLFDVETLLLVAFL